MSKPSEQLVLLPIGGALVPAALPDHRELRARARRRRERQRELAEARAAVQAVREVGQELDAMLEAYQKETNQ